MYIKGYARGRGIKMQGKTGLWKALVFCAALMQATSALAAEDGGAPEKPAGLAAMKGRPRVTSSLQLAMIFYKLANKVPNFDLWAADSEEYADSAVFEHDFVLEKQKKTIRDTFASYSKSEPVILQSNVILSKYDNDAKQFTITNLRPSAYFPYTYARRNYAVVPLGFEHNRFVKVEGQTAINIETQAAQTQRHLLMLLYMQPIVPKRAADFPITLGQKAYYLISGNVLNRALYDEDGRKFLWEEHPDMPWKETQGWVTDQDKSIDLQLDLKPQ